MSHENDSARPLRLIEVLEAEFEYLHHPLPAADAARDGDSVLAPIGSDSENFSEQERDDQRREIALRRHVHGLPRDERRAALCLSGGGVRSATFALGVVQALAKQGWLGQFHYMSSVSGGGYTASWLSSWIARSSGGVDSVIASIAGNDAGAAHKAAPEPAQVKRLRAYSNYLSPVHGLSMDLITLIATFVRNLVLHWAVIVPMLAAVIVLPRLNFAIMLQLAQDPVSWVIRLLLGMLVVIGVFGFVNILMLLPGYSSKPSRTTRFVARCYLPLFVATLMLSWIIPALGRSWETSPFAHPLLFAFFGAVLLSLCKLLAVLLQRHAVPGQDRMAGIFPLMIAGAVAGLLLLAIVRMTGQGGDGQWRAHGDLAGAGTYAMLAVPALLTSLWLCMTLHVGLSHPTNTREDEREWWARASAYMFWTIVAWLIVNGVVMLGPWLLLRQTWGAELAGSAGLLGLATSAYGYWSKHGSALQRKLKSAISLAGDRIFEIAAGLFIVALVMLLSVVLALASAPAVPGVACPGASSANMSLCSLYVARTMHALTFDVGLVLLVLIALMSLGSYFVGANTFSLHNMYGNRLVRAYLGASNSDRKPDPFTGFDPLDNCLMSTLKKTVDGDDRSKRRLFHVVNIALNLVKPSPDRLEWQHRKAAGFTVSALHVGAECTGFQPSHSYSGEKGISLARAMTISGAAATPNMGYHTSTLVAFAMTFFNIRLGWWLPNPGTAGKKYWHRGEPQGGMASLLKESLATTTNESGYVYLSDGGHFENLGLYEMVRRRCHHIVVVDAGCDPGYQFEDLENAVRKIRTDLGISIVFPQGLPTPGWARGDKNKHQHASVGTIRYADMDGEHTNGVIIYIKPLLSGNEPLDITRYAALAKKNQRNPFPHHPTSDQFFDEVRFESYRALGYHSVMCDKVLGRDARTDGEWPLPDVNGVDATEAELAAAEVIKGESRAAGGESAALGILGTAGLMWLSTIAIPAVVALGLAALVALGHAIRAPEKAGQAGISAGEQDINVRLATRADVSLPALEPRLVQLLSATELLHAALDKASGENRKIVDEMHRLLKEEMELARLWRGRDRSEQTLVTLDVLMQFKEALKKDPVLWSDPGLVRIFDKLDETKKMIEAERIGSRLHDIEKGLTKIESGVSRANPRINVRAATGGEQ